MELRLTSEQAALREQAEVFSRELEPVVEASSELRRRGMPSDGDSREVTGPSGLDPPALLWAGDACCRVIAVAHQLHGAGGFALETGLHGAHRRAKTTQVWVAAVCSATG